jgi:hypothetical protein
MSGLFQDYISAQIITKTPGLMQQYMEDRNAQRLAGATLNVMGQEAQPAREEPFQYPMMEGEQPIGGLMTQVPAQPATGLFAGATPEEAQNLSFNKRALESGEPRFQQMAIQNLQQQQASVLGPANTVGAGRYIFEDDKGNQYWVGNVANKVTKDMETIYSPIGKAPKEPQGPLKMVDRTYGLTAEGKLDFEQAKARAVQEAELRTKDEVESLISYVPKTMAIEDAVFNIETTQSYMNELAGLSDYSTTGFGKYLNAIPLTDANRWRELASTVTGRLAMDKMMELKAASAVGATGFGALSEKELKLLQDYYGNLAQSQDPAVIKRNMQLIYEQLEYAKKRQRSKMAHNMEKYLRVHQKYNPGRPLPTYVQQHMRSGAAQPPTGQQGRSWNDLPEE